MIIDTTPHVLVGNNDNVGGKEEGKEEEEEVKPEEEEEQDNAMDEGNKEFVSVILWETNLASTVADWAPTAQDHRKAIKLLQQAVSKSFIEKKRFVALLEEQTTRAL